eukprot:m.25651 g.25651  ORF g.25651 m.25651 type:complete len:89 (+) comp8745_c0_seq1:3084-3350(+)
MIIEPSFVCYCATQCYNTLHERVYTSAFSANILDAGIFAPSCRCMCVFGESVVVQVVFGLHCSVRCYLIAFFILFYFLNSLALNMIAR